MDAQDVDVLAANATFYEAINRRDIAHMDDLWARDAPLACIHPGWDALEGRDQVMQSWRSILGNPQSPRIEISEASPHVYGTTAFVVCVETLDGNALVATNVFVREGAVWRLVHHHAGPIARRPAPRRPLPRKPPPPSHDLN